MRLLRGIAAPLLVAWLAAPLEAQDRQKAPLQLFRLLDSGGHLYLRGRAQNENQSQSSTGQTTRQTDRSIEEGLDLHGSGYAYHPNLLDWEAGVRLGAAQEWLTLDSRQMKSNDRLLGYNLTGTFLKEKPVSFRAFASQDQNLRQRDFARSAVVSDQRQGMEIWSKGPVPLTLLAEQIRSTETSEIRDIDKQTRHLRFSATDQRSPDWMTQLVLDHQDTAETSTFFPSGAGTGTTEDFPDQADEAELTNRWRWGPGEDKHSLTGRIRALDRRGFFPNRVLSAEEQLVLIHSKTFSTYYRALGDINNTDQDKERTINGEAGFKQKVYDSLDITGRVVGNDHRNNDEMDQTLGGFLDLAYRKETAIGRYNSSLLLGREYQKQSSGTGQQMIRDEAVVLNALDYTRLAKPGVIAGSILVTDQTHTITYLENVDYLLRTTGAFTEIARKAGGDITDGQKVLVTYTVQAARRATFTTDHFGWNNRLKLKDVPLSLYVNYRLRDQNLRSGEDPNTLDHERNLLGGIEWDYKRFTVTLEREKHDTLLYAPSVADRARAGYAWSLEPTVELSVGAQAEKLRYSKAAEFGLLPGQDFLDTVGGYLSLTAKPRPDTLLRFNSDILKTKGREDRVLFRNMLRLEWTYGKIEFSIEARHDTFVQENSRGSSDSIMFNFKRSF